MAIWRASCGSRRRGCPARTRPRQRESPEQASKWAPAGPPDDWRHPFRGPARPIPPPGPCRPSPRALRRPWPGASTELRRRLLRRPRKPRKPPAPPASATLTLPGASRAARAQRALSLGPAAAAGAPAAAAWTAAWAAARGAERCPRRRPGRLRSLPAASAAGRAR